MRRRTLTAVSALLNVVLIVVVLWQAHLLQRPMSGPIPAGQGRGETAAVVPSSSSSLVPEPAVEPANRTSHALPAGPLAGGQTVQIAPPESLPSATNRPRLAWKEVESDDYRAYVANLRRIDCPGATVRDIVTADVLQAFAAQRGQAVAARFRDFNYWRTDEQDKQAREQLEKQRRTIDEEMTGMLRELLGTDAAPPPTDHQWRQAAWEQQLSFLPEEKRQKTVGLLLQNAEVDDRIRALADGRRTPESAEERQHALVAYDVRRQDMNALLTPEEYLQVELTVSWTADNLRRAMQRFQPTEEEFRAVFREWRAHDEALARLYATGQPDPGNDLVFAKVREALGEKRYEEYRSTWWK